MNRIEKLKNDVYSFEELDTLGLCRTGPFASRAR
jgi:hypothetical protein